MILVLTLTGCSTIADSFDRADPCQGFTPERGAYLGRPIGYQQPSWCGASKGSRSVIRDASGRIIGTVNTR